MEDTMERIAYMNEDQIKRDDVKLQERPMSVTELAIETKRGMQETAAVLSDMRIKITGDESIDFLKDGPAKCLVDDLIYMRNLAMDMCGIAHDLDRKLFFREDMVPTK